MFAVAVVVAVVFAGVGVGAVVVVFAGVVVGGGAVAVVVAVVGVVAGGVEMTAAIMLQRDDRIMGETFALNLVLDPTDNRRYMRVTDTTDILRGIARSLEIAGLCDGSEISDQLRKIARELEEKVAVCPMVQP